jgi:hypothetical protein
MKWENYKEHAAILCSYIAEIAYNEEVLKETFDPAVYSLMVNSLSIDPSLNCSELIYETFKDTGLTPKTLSDIQASNALVKSNFATPSAKKYTLEKHMLSVALEIQNTSGVTLETTHINSYGEVILKTDENKFLFSTANFPNYIITEYNDLFSKTCYLEGNNITYPIEGVDKGFSIAEVAYLTSIFIQHVFGLDTLKSKSLLIDTLKTEKVHESIDSHKDTLNLLVEMGHNDEDDLADILASLNRMHQLMGGSGLEFRLNEVREEAKVLV